MNLAMVGRLTVAVCLTSSGIVPVTVSNTAGSFMSFQMPVMPMSVNIL